MAAASKQERTYQVLRQRIVDGVYGPGHRLVIDALARELDVSQMPVREAIRRLEAEGWVTYVRNQGAQVAPIDADSWVEAMGTLAVLEGYATALAAPELTAGDLARMREINEAMLAAIESLDVLAVSERNLAFHRVVYERCPNAHLRREIEQIQERLDTLRRSIFLYIPTRGRVSIEEHEALLAKIEGGADPLEIELAAREHKLHTISAYQERAAAR
ncbi:MAG: GntR family transcriptional regulator [Solirubrobacteraceae bacterium]|nr:GntR family transcriptional regulator [Solirubrobacteraceae bacterium]